MSSTLSRIQDYLNNLEGERSEEYIQIVRTIFFQYIFVFDDNILKINWKNYNTLDIFIEEHYKIEVILVETQIINHVDVTMSLCAKSMSSGIYLKVFSDTTRIGETYVSVLGRIKDSYETLKSQRENTGI